MMFDPKSAPDPLPDIVEAKKEDLQDNEVEATQLTSENKEAKKPRSPKKTRNSVKDIQESNDESGHEPAGIGNT